MPIGNFGLKTRLLPYLEQVAMWNSVNVTYNGEAPQGQNDTVLTLQLNAFLCPSDGNIPVTTWTFKNGVTGTRQIGYSNYPNNIGTIARNNGGSFDGPAYYMGAQLAPAMAQGPTLTLASIVDGTSNTVIFSEWLKGKNDTSSTTGAWQILMGSSAYPTTNTYVLPSVYSSSCQSSTKLSATNENLKGCFWYNDKCGQGGGYSHISTPNLKSCMFSNDGDAQPDHTMVGASSNHPGGVNVGMLDGSVKFIKNSINPMTWWGIATKAGGEVIDASSY